MKILVISKDLKHPIRLYFPTALLKSKFIWKRIIKKDAASDFDYDALHHTIKVGYKALVKFIKVNGHFDLVHIVDKDGEVIKIRV